MRALLAGFALLLVPLVPVAADAAPWGGLTTYGDSTTYSGSTSYGNPTPSVKADKVLVVKSERRLYLLQDSHVIRTFRVALGPNPVGRKMFQGDGRTPEGLYILDWRKANSRFYRAINISYPSDADIARAASFGSNPGGQVMLHGQPRDGFNGNNPYFDWTEGCIALSNDEMDEVWMAVDDGTPIEILP